LAEYKAKFTSKYAKLAVKNAMPHLNRVKERRITTMSVPPHLDHLPIGSGPLDAQEL